MIRWSFPVALLLTITACAGAPEAPESQVAAEVPVAPAAPVRPSGIILENFDRSVRPQDDLYRHVNGAWLARTEIPADKSNYGTFTVLQDNVEAPASNRASRTGKTSGPGRRR